MFLIVACSQTYYFLIKDSCLTSTALNCSIVDKTKRYDSCSPPSFSTGFVDFFYNGCVNVIVCLTGSNNSFLTLRTVQLVSKGKQTKTSKTSNTTFDSKRSSISLIVRFSWYVISSIRRRQLKKRFLLHVLAISHTK